MANYTSILKDNAWLTADEVGEWLYDDKSERYEVPTEGEYAFLVEQFLRFTAQTIGVSGNAITIQYIAGGAKGSEVVSVVGNDITVTIEDGVSTAEDVRSAISASGAASALISVQLEIIPPDEQVDVEVRTQNIFGPTNLAGGVDDIPFPKKDVPVRRKRLERLINSACDKIESIIDGNILSKQFQEDLDGNDSNVIIPSRWPILSVEKLYIDYNRNFTENSVLDTINYILRGSADKRMDLSFPDIRVIGSSVYLRDDDETNIIGRVFSGSVAGSIRIQYTAGWARNVNDVPEDLKLATLQLVEWYEFRRSNKDIGYSSKGVRGESYAKSAELEEGIPIEIYQSISKYINYGFGTFEKIQNNIMGV